MAELRINFSGMIRTFLIALFFIATSFTPWQPNFQTAVDTAKEKNELILLNFSGSDWCGPCIRMDKEIFSSESFSNLAANSLVMVNADFPRSKKNQLDKEAVKQNEQLADKYNPNGYFPYTLLITPEGKVLKAWEGFPNEDAAAFTAEVKAICDAHK